MEALSRNAIFSISIALEAGILLLAAVWMVCAHIQLAARFQFSAAAIGWGLAVAAGTTLLSMLCVTLGKRFSLFAGLRKLSEELLAPLLRKLTPSDIFFLSLVSGFCEEVFFRGIVQSQWGLIPTSLAFGIFHDPSFKQKSYVIMAALAGLALGYLYQQTGNLWSCITAHAVHNMLSMIALRFWFKEPTDTPQQ
jgi:uncharacterized protein